MLADLVDGVKIQGRDREQVARLKGDEVMATVLAKAVRDRKRAAAPAAAHRPRPADAHAVGGHVGRRSSATPAAATGSTTPAAASSSARWPFHLADSARTPARARRGVAPGPQAPRRARPRSRGCGRCSRRPSCSTTCSARKALLHLAGRPATSTSSGVELLHRPRSESVDDVVWTHDDVPLLDEARALLGPKPRRQTPRRRRDPHLRPHRGRRGPGPLADAAGA